jgi:hypothetical protein
VRDDLRRSAHRPYIKTTVNQSFTTKRAAMKNGILNFPIPDYSHIPAKVDCWRRNGEIRSKDKKVRGAMTCGVVHM